MDQARRLMLFIDEEQAGRRVDTLLRRELNLSGSAVRRAKRIEGGITLDDRTVFTNVLAAYGQTLSVRVGDRPSLHASKAEAGLLTIAFEDEDLLILDKAAPLAVHPSPTYPSATVLNHLLYYYQQIGLQADFHPVSRLDRGTSGLMVVAKHAHAHERLASQLHSADFCRSYLAICEGAPKPLTGVIDAPIGRVPGEVLRRAILRDGAPSRTHYITLQQSTGRSLLRLRLETGRTHQIRVHMASLGIPLVGDFLYGEESPDLPDRFALHSTEIDLIHPISGKRLHIHSPLPPELAALL